MSFIFLFFLSQDSTTPTTTTTGSLKKPRRSGLLNKFFCCFGPKNSAPKNSYPVPAVEQNGNTKVSRITCALYVRIL